MIKAISVLCLVTAPLWLYLLLFPQGFDYLAGIVVFLVALIADLALIMHVSRADAELRQIMVVGLFLKMLAAAAYLTFTLHYGQGGDYLFYFQEGSKIANSLIQRGEIGRVAGIAAHEGVNGTTMLHLLTGFLFLVVTPTLTGGIVIFSSIAFWGVFLFWKAFATAFPGADASKAGVLLFFMPSIAFWPSTIGKDALLSFTIGLTAFGLASVMYGARTAGLLNVAVGVVATAAIRPHIGAILAMSLTVTYLFGKNRAGLAGGVTKMIGIPLIVFGTYYVFSQARESLGVQDVGRVAQVANSWSEVTAYGGSSFEGGSLTKRILMAPALPFRPFPWEVSSVQTLIASAEGMFLLGLFWVHRRAFKHSVAHWRSQPLVGFILFFSMETAVALSSAFSNFGLLARERVMFTPLLLMLVAAFPARQAVTSGAAVAYRARMDSMAASQR